MINIDELIKNAMKSKNHVELRAYKNLKAEIQLIQTAKNAKPYDDAAEISILKKMVKQREDSEKQYLEAGRKNLAIQEYNESEIIKKLLPAPVNESDIYEELYNHGLNIGWSRFEKIEGTRGGNLIIQIPKKEMGNAIKHLKSKFPQVDGKIISDIVKTYIV